MILYTTSQPFRKARKVDATGSAFPSRIPAIIEPAGEGVIELGLSGEGCAPNGILLVPYAQCNNNDIFNVRLLGWRKLGTTLPLWVPFTLIQINCTASATVGVPETGVPATHRFADVLTLTIGNDDVSVDLVSPDNDLIAHVVADLKGANKAEIVFAAVSGSVTGMNCLYAML